MHDLQRNYEQEIRELVDTAHELARLGHVASHGGNLSWRVAPATILITPTKTPKGSLCFDDIVIVDDSCGTVFAAPGREPTGETPLHVRVLGKRPDVSALIHAHPPILTGLAIARSDLMALPVLPEPVIEVGPMAAVPYVEPVSDSLAEAFDRVVGDANAFLMHNHGVMIASVVSLTRALELLRMLETTALSLVTAMQTGEVNQLTEEEIARLDDVRARRGLPLPGAPGRYASLGDAYGAVAG